MAVLATEFRAFLVSLFFTPKNLKLAWSGCLWIILIQPPGENISAPILQFVLCGSNLHASFVFFFRVGLCKIVLACARLSTASTVSLKIIFNLFISGSSTFQWQQLFCNYTLPYLFALFKRLFVLEFIYLYCGFTVRWIIPFILIYCLQYGKPIIEAIFFVIVFLEIKEIIRGGFIS